MAKQQPAKAENCETWLTKAEVVAQTNLGLRTIERLMAKGTLRHAHRRVPGRKPISVIHPEDVAKLKAETLAPKPVPRIPEVVRPQQSAIPTRALTVRQPVQGPLAREAPVRLTEKFFLTLPEAVQLSGLPAAYLKRLIAERRLSTIKAGGYRIRRADLAQL